MTTKKNAVLFISSLVIIIWIGLAQAQKAKTVKLPNGEEVVDIRGEWDAYFENYGLWSKYGKDTNVLEITLKGYKFYGFRMKDGKYHPRNTLSIRGELDKGGIKKIQLFTGLVGWIDAKGQISEDGNKIIVDAANKVRITLIRK